MLNVLLSFAQFEREIISERTREQIAASRRKGKWGGGVPVLGYDVDAVTGKLVVNEGKAARFRAIFDLYRQHRSIITTVKDLDDRDWLTKKSVTKAGTTTGGKPFDKASLHRLLTNAIYLGHPCQSGQDYPDYESAKYCPRPSRVPPLSPSN